MVLKEALSENFSLFGVAVEDDSVLAKCLDLCDIYNLTEESLVNSWMAYSVTHCQGAGPTVELLGQMERRELKKDSGPMPFKADNNLSKIAVYNSHSMKQFNDDDDDDDVDIIELYAPKTPTTKAKRLRSPESDVASVEVKVRAVDSPFSPSSYSPKTTTPSRFSSTLNRGKVLLKYGRDPGGWKNSASGDKVKISRSQDHEHVPPKALYMYEKLANKAAALDSLCESLGFAMCQITNDLDKVDLEPVGCYSRSQYQMQTYGRICCDSQGKLNPASVLLEGTKLTSTGARVKMDLTNLNQYSIFPGQIVSVKGVNPTGKTLVVRNLFFENPPPPPETKMGSFNDQNSLHIVVAAGPFTAPDNLKYEPLMDLIRYVAENQPHVLILVGPFVEFDHQEVQRCEMAASFDEFFERCIGNIMAGIKETSTQVVLVPSNRDVNHEPVYPTPEFKMIQKYPHLHSMPDPCMIDIGGLVIGTTSVDSLMHLGREEISFNAMKFDRLTRLATHILAQRCFYPLVPPLQEVNVDTDLWEKHAIIGRQPHILILPSSLRYFCKNIYDCVALNPERLVKGSFARIKVTGGGPSQNGDWKPADNVAVEILKI